MKTSKDNKYLLIDNETVVPIPDNNIEWILRYGSSEDIVKHRLYIASIVSQYKHLLNSTNQRRNYIANKIKSFIRGKVK